MENSLPSAKKGLMRRSASTPGTLEVSTEPSGLPVIVP